MAKYKVPEDMDDKSYLIHSYLRNQIPKGFLGFYERDFALKPFLIAVGILVLIAIVLHQIFIRV